jgi:hypothetical protein
VYSQNGSRDIADYNLEFPPQQWYCSATIPVTPSSIRHYYPILRVYGHRVPYHLCQIRLWGHVDIAASQPLPRESRNYIKRDYGFNRWRCFVGIVMIFLFVVFMNSRHGEMCSHPSCLSPRFDSRLHSPSTSPRTWTFITYIIPRYPSIAY